MTIAGRDPVHRRVARPGPGPPRPGPSGSGPAHRDAPGGRGAADHGVPLVREAVKKAIRRLTEALDGYAQAGVRQGRIRHRLRKLGVCRRHRGPSAVRPVSGWASLTDTECAASQLDAHGLKRGDRQRYGHSGHTVACHLRQVFRKLNIGSRVELALIVIEQGLGDN